MQYLLFPEGMFYNKENNVCRAIREILFSWLLQNYQASRKVKKNNPDIELGLSRFAEAMLSTSNFKSEKQSESEVKKSELHLRFRAHSRSDFFVEAMLSKSNFFITDMEAIAQISIEM